MWRESRINKAGRLIRPTKALGIDHGSTGKCIGGTGRQLFAYTLGNRVKAGARASGEFYSFHCSIEFNTILLKSYSLRRRSHFYRRHY